MRLQTALRCDVRAHVRIAASETLYGTLADSSTAVRTQLSTAKADVDGTQARLSAALLDPLWSGKGLLDCQANQANT